LNLTVELNLFPDSAVDICETFMMNIMSLGGIVLFICPSSTYEMGNKTGGQISLAVLYGDRSLKSMQYLTKWKINLDTIQDCLVS
jgi:hypothetical protein